MRTFRRYSMVTITNQHIPCPTPKNLFLRQFNYLLEQATSDCSG